MPLDTQESNEQLESETQHDSQQDSQQTIQQTPTQQVPPTNVVSVDPSYLAALEQTHRESQRQLAAVTEQLATMQQQFNQANQPPRDKEAERALYFDDPGAATEQAISRVLSRELDQRMAPLQQLFAEQKKASVYSSAKGKAKSDPRFAQAFAQYPQLDALLDQQLSSVDFTSLTSDQVDQTVMMGVVQVVGALQMGLIPGVSAQQIATPQPTPNQQVHEMRQQNMEVPHMRPTAPTAPQAPRNTPQRPPLTEAERTIMRINGFKSEEEYYQWMNISPTEVATSQIGRETK